MSYSEYSLEVLWVRLQSWSCYHCLSKHRLGHGCLYCHHFKWTRNIIDITCFEFNLYLRYLQKDHTLIWHWNKNFMQKGKDNRTAGCQFDISKANFYHWKDSINLIYSCNVTSNYFTRLLRAELCPSNIRMLKLSSNMTSVLRRKGRDPRSVLAHEKGEATARRWLSGYLQAKERGPQ